MTVTRNAVNGSYAISDIVGNRLVSRTYYGYTKREAVTLFTDDIFAEAITHYDSPKEWAAANDKRDSLP